MAKRKKKLTPAQKRAKKKRQKEFMTIFINGKQKRVRRPPTIDGMDVDEFIRQNADPIWLHQHEMWEYMDQNKTIRASFDEIVFDVESFMNNKSAGEKFNLRERLIQSSLVLNGAGCDGILIGEAEKYTNKILHRLNDEELHSIWKETENGVLCAQQNVYQIHRSEMVHHITLDVIQNIVDSICMAAKTLLKEAGKDKS